MFGTRLSRLGSVSRLGLVPKAIAILRKYGADAHVYLPGVGTISGLTAGNYLNSAGTTAASVDNPVGLSLDALQAMTLGADVLGGKGNFANTADWSKEYGWSIASNKATFNEATASNLYRTDCVSGVYYVVTFRVTRIASGVVRARVGSTFGASRTSTGTYTEIILSSGTLSGLEAASNSVSTNADIDSFTIQQIPGIHATQGTTANKPMLRRGLLNLLLNNNDFSTFSKSTLNITPGVSDPFGGTTASTLTATSANSEMWKVTTVPAGNYTSALWIRRKTGSGTVSVRNSANSAWIPLALTSNFQFLVNDGGAVASNNGYVDILIATSGDEIDVCRGGLFQGTLTAQQIIDAGGIPLTTAAAASSTTGKYWWQFDGSNDSLSLSAPLFQLADDHCVIVGAYCASAPSPYAMIVNPSFLNSTNYAAIIYVDSTGKPSAEWYRTGIAKTLTGPASIVGSPTVLTARKITDTKVLRVNGVQVATDSTPQAAITTVSGSIGNFNNSGHWPGHIYPIIAIKGTLSDSDLLVLERFVGQLSGVSI